MLKNQETVLVNLAALTIFDGTDRQWVSRLWYKYTKDQYMTLNRVQHDRLFALRRKYLPTAYELSVGRKKKKIPFHPAILHINCSKNISNRTIGAINKMVELAYNKKPLLKTLSPEFIAS